MARRTTASPPPPDETVAEEPPAASPSAESGFFGWLRRLGVERQSGWLGGVCGGLAARIGIDPLIVRGIAVVLAVVGAPVALLYAIAWFLLPDEHGTIHAQQLGHGRVTRALPGIVAVFLISFLPLTQGFWVAGALYWGYLGWGGSLVRAAWTLVLFALVVVIVVWLARRSSRDIATVPATTDDQPDTVPVLPAEAADAAGDAALAAASAPAAVLPEPGEPPAPPADASAEELANWKASQDAWQQQRAAWAAEQRRSERERRQAEANARAQEALVAARERARIRKLTRPRANAGIVFLVLGVALVAAAIAAFAAGQSTETRPAVWMIGASVLVLVLGAGTVAVALGRRRSGVLALFSILSVLVLALAVVLPGDRITLPPGANMGISGAKSGRYAQLVGTTSLYVPNRDDATATIDLWQAVGSVQVQLDEGATIRLELTTPRDEYAGSVSVDERFGDDSNRSSWYRVKNGRLTLTAGDGTPDVVLRVWLGSGWVNITSWSSGTTPLTLSPKPDESSPTGESGGPAVEPVPTETDPAPTDPATDGATSGGTDTTGGN